MTVALVGASAPLTDLITHITIDPRLAMLEYGIAPALIATQAPAGAAAPSTAPDVAPATTHITVDPRTEMLNFGLAPPAIVTTAPDLHLAPAPAGRPEPPTATIAADPRFAIAAYPHGSPWAALGASYRRI